MHTGNVPPSPSSHHSPEHETNQAQAELMLLVEAARAGARANSYALAHSVSRQNEERMNRAHALRTLFAASSSGLPLSFDALSTPAGAWNGDVLTQERAYKKQRTLFPSDGTSLPQTSELYDCHMPSLGIDSIHCHPDVSSSEERAYRSLWNTSVAAISNRQTVGYSQPAHFSECNNFSSLPPSLSLSLFKQDQNQVSAQAMMVRENIGGNTSINFDHMVQTPSAYQTQQKPIVRDLFLKRSPNVPPMNILHDPMRRMAVENARSALLEHGYRASDIEVLQSIANGNNTEGGTRPGLSGDRRKVVHENNHVHKVPSISLVLPHDSETLSQQQCFLRKQIEAFSATTADASTHIRGRNKPVLVGQVGIRCIHCSALPILDRKAGAVYFPSSLEGIYQAAQNIQKYHLRNGCQNIPLDIQKECNEIISCKSNLGGGKHYWIDAARCIGMVDTPDGIRFQYDIAHKQQQNGKNHFYSSLLTPSSYEAVSSISDESKISSSSGISDGIVHPDDRSHTTDYLYVLFCQVSPCSLSDADRIGSRKDKEIGLPGLECKHCGGGSGNGRFFRTTAASIAKNENITQICKHIMSCGKCPDEVKISVNTLKQLHPGQMAKLKRGWKKFFFESIMQRLCETIPQQSIKKTHESQE